LQLIRYEVGSILPYHKKASIFMNILIIEDHPLITAALRATILASYPHADIEDADTFPDGLELLQNKKFDLLILDIDIPGGEDTLMIQIIKKKQKDCSILVNSGFDEKIYAIPFLQAGADGYISKNAKSSELKIAIQTVFEKRKYASAAIQDLLVSNLQTDHQYIPEQLRGLSPNEFKVMKMLIEGYMTKQIAIQMELKENTISTYKKRVFAKLNVKTLLELSKKASLLNFRL